VIHHGSVNSFAEYYTAPYINKGRWREVAPVVFCGSFNPWHQGHESLLSMVNQRFPKRGNYIIELSAVNADKGIIYPDDIKQRLQAIPSIHLTFADGFLINVKRRIGTAPTFVDKLNVYYNPLFVVGTDTMMRIGDKKYYRDYDAAMDKLVNEATFFVALRGHTELEVKKALPLALYNKCTFVEHEFAAVSSTNIRGD